jgi:hypothetical protein
MGTARELVAESGSCPEELVSAEMVNVFVQKLLAGVQLQRLKVLGELLGHDVRAFGKSQALKSCMS